MKISLPALALAALALHPLSHAAHSDKQAPFDPVDGISLAHGDSLVSSSLDQLDKLRDSGLSLEEAIAQLQKELAGMPTTDELRLRLQLALDDLIARARAAYVHEYDLAVLRRQFVDARLDRAFRLLHLRAEGGGWSSDQIRTVALAWLARAEVFVDAPDPDAYRARVMAVIDLAIAKTGSVAESILEMRLQLLRLQLESATLRLQQARDDGLVTAADYDRLLAIYIARARAIYQSTIGG